MKLSEITKTLNPLAEITEGREKMQISDLYGKTATVDSFMIATDETGKDYAVVHCKEYPNYFHFGGTMETKILKLIEGDAEATNEFKQTGIKLHYSLGRTKQNQNFTVVSIEQ